MKKKVMGIIAVVAIAVVAGYNVCASQNNMKLSDLTLSNMDALAFPEIGTGFYHRYTYQCPIPVEYKTAVSCTSGGHDECYPSDC
ncbi:NVEALA domain-containing protein [Bacteroides caecimuris]|uniref:NVEALA protein n=1 Tax=Bacteroides caecimuris TaxID=1796613 RepID=A0A4V3RGP9_9BACE|nr:NVEALA domain-containing protein [Bacteroides caecimuris]TGY25140.1 hypothetical protein E5353_17795 [Bacteroides caecimuris]